MKEQNFSDIVDTGEYLYLSLLEHEVRLEGKCTEFVQERELYERHICRYEQKSEEHPEWKPIAQYTRNKNYYAEETQSKKKISQNIRTPQTLKKCLAFIGKEYIDKQLEQFMQADKDDLLEKLLYFLDDRVKAIRQEYFVQKIFDPNQTVKIFKLTLIIETLLKVRMGLVGLSDFISVQLIPHLQSRYRKSYIEALKYSILVSGKGQLLFILNNHPIILEQRELQNALKIRKKIQFGNYVGFLDELSKNSDFMVRFLLWGKIDEMRQKIICILTKAKMKVKKKWLCKIMGYPKQEGDIQMGKEEVKELNENEKELHLPISEWISKKEILNEVRKIFNQ